MQTEFEFVLPKGYVDGTGTVHQQGIMRLSRAMDEIVPLRDPRVKANPAYATVIILSRVIVKLGSLEEVTPGVVEDFFTKDLDYLQTFYRQINDLSYKPSRAVAPPAPSRVVSNEKPPVNSSASQDSQVEDNRPMSMDEFILSEAGDGPPIMPPSPKAQRKAAQK